MTIKLFPMEEMTYTPFEHTKGVNFLREHGIVLTNDLREADLLLARRWRAGTLTELLFRYRARKPLLIWTLEPRFCTLSKDLYQGPFGIPRIHVMDVYTKNVYLCNYSIHGYNISKKLPLITPSDLTDKQRKAVALAGYSANRRRQRLVMHGVDIDLVLPRQELILEGHRRKMVDVHGRNWPAGIAIGESRGGDYQSAKMAVLKNYRFNICMENTDWDYYVTEKIWEAITARCLPIYRGGKEKIYEDFERGSFVDPNDFPNAEKLLDHVASMSDTEYCDRVNSCINSYNKIWERGDYEAQYRRTAEAIVHRVREIVASG